MSSWRFQINAGSGWIDLTDYNGRSLITRDSIEVRRDTHNKGKSVIDTIAFDIISPDQTLIQTLYNQKSYEPIDLLVDRDGDRYFTGYLRPVDDLEARAEGVAETTISVQGVDVLWKLQRTLDNDFSRTSETVDNIVRDLLELGGIPTSKMVFSATLSQTVQEFQEEADDREILDILDDLLYEYHHNLAANPDGEIDLFNWLDPETSPVATFDESIDRIEARKTDDDYGYVAVSHWRFETVGNDDGTGLVTLHESVVRNLDSTSSYTADLSLDFPVPDDAEILSVSDLEIKFSISGASVIGTAVYTIHGSGVGYRNVGGSETGTPMRLRYGDGVRFDFSSSASGQRAVSVSINFADKFRYNVDSDYDYGGQAEFEGGEYTVHDLTFTVRGKATYRQRSKEQRASVSTAGALNARTERYDAEYIYSDTDGRSLAEAILQIRQYGSKKWTIRTSSLVPIGSVVNVTAGPFGLTVRGRVQRITDSQSNATPDGLQEYVYLVETLESATATSSSVSSTVPSLPAFPVAPSDISSRPTFDDIMDGIDETGNAPDLPPPALSATATTRKASLSVGYASALISGSLRVQLQISDDDTDWYSLGPGGNSSDAWKGTLDDVTQIVGTAYTHDELPLTGTASNPLQTTYYYRARIVSRGLVSDWSDSQAVVVSPVLEGDIGANTITAQKIAANSVTAAKIKAGEVTTEKLNANAVTAEKIAADAITAEKTAFGDLESLDATLAGWNITTNWIAAPDDTVRIRKDERRLEVRDGSGAIKTADGYLDNITKADGTSFSAGSFGQYVGAGSTVYVESDEEYADGTQWINRDAAFVSRDGLGNEIVRLGSGGAGDVVLQVGSHLQRYILVDENGNGIVDENGDYIVTTIQDASKAGLFYSLADQSLTFSGTLTVESQIGNKSALQLLDDIDRIDLDLSSLGALAYLEKVEEAQLGETVISGGFILTDLIDVGDIITRGSIVVGDELESAISTNVTTISGGKITTGEIKSAGYDEGTPTGAWKLDLDNGIFRSDDFVSGASGFNIDSNGVEIDDGTFIGGSIDIGSGAFTVGPAGDVFANSLELGGGVLSGSVDMTADGKIFADSVVVTTTGTVTEEQSGYFQMDKVGFENVYASPSGITTQKSSIDVGTIRLENEYVSSTNPNSHYTFSMYIFGGSLVFRRTNENTGSTTYFYPSFT